MRLNERGLSGTMAAVTVVSRRATADLLRRLFTRRDEDSASLPAPDDGRAVRFYRQERPDHRGRMLSDIQAWDDQQLATVHDYVQWLFPLAEPSAYNARAPVLGPSDIAEFRKDAALRISLLESFVRMLRFYGLRLVSASGQPSVTRLPEFESRADFWLTRGSHQALRITRMLRSCHLLGLGPHALAFYRCLMELAMEFPDRVDEESLRHWAEAVEERS